MGVMKKVQVNIQDKTYKFELRQADGKVQIKRNGSEHAADLVRLRSNRYSLIIDGRSYEFGLEHNGDGYTISLGSRSGLVRVEDYELARIKKAAGIDDGARVKKITAPMPGLIVRVNRQAGDEVKRGEALVVMEAMKMENDIKSPLAGKIRNINVSPGESVEKGHLLVEFE
jgi:acetyl/propionyl-CoA carboxylase alpha subunit